MSACSMFQLCFLLRLGTLLNKVKLWDSVFHECDNENSHQADMENIVFKPDQNMSSWTIFLVNIHNPALQCFDGLLSCLQQKHKQTKFQWPNWVPACSFVLFFNLHSCLEFSKFCICAQRKRLLFYPNTSPGFRVSVPKNTHWAFSLWTQRLASWMQCCGH